MRELMRSTPNWVLTVCGTIIALALISGVVVLTATGKSTDDLIRLINTVMNVISVLGIAGAWASSASAAKSAANAERQTNSTGRTETERQADGEETRGHG